MADPLPGDVVESHLANELGPQSLPYEFLVGLPAARLTGSALVGAIRLQQLDQLPLLARLEAGGVSHHVQLAIVAVQAQDERADRALLLAEAEGGHHRIRRADALDLDHPGALARQVRRASFLRHDALRQASEPLPRVVAVGGDRGEQHRIGDHGGEPLAALVVGKLEQQLVALGEEVERNQPGRRLLGQPLDPRRGRVYPL